MAVFANSSSSASLCFQSETFLTGMHFMWRYFGMQRLLKEGSVRIWRGYHLRYHSHLTHGLLHLGTLIFHSQLTSLMHPLIALMHGSWRLTNSYSKKSKDGIRAQIWLTSWAELQRVWSAWQGEVAFNIPFYLTNYGTISQVGWFTSDSAAINCTTLRLLQNSPLVGTEWMAREYDML